MRYSTESRNQISVNGYVFLSLAKIIGQNVSKNILIVLNLMFKNACKRGIQKTAEATGDLSFNKSADETTNTSSQNVS